MRQPKLRKKKVGKHKYCYTEANGGAYFGVVGDVPYKDAKKHFGDHIKEKQAPIPADLLTVGEMFSKFLAWLQENRSDSQYRRRRRDCSRFGKFVVEGQILAHLPCTEISGDMMEKWLATLKLPTVKDDPDVNARVKRGLNAQSLLHAETSVRHAFNWASKHNSPHTLVPPNYRPFAGIERTKVPPKGLSESDLLTELEVEALLEAAKFDLDQFRRWGVEKHIEKHGRKKLRPSKDSFADMLRVYHSTGARTTELATARIRQFSARSSQITLSEHKTAKSARAKVRHINLNEDGVSIVQRLCKGRGPDEFIFQRPWGKPWTKKNLNTRLHGVRRLAVALGAEIREDVTIYDFRHLWISEALMAGVDVMAIARMAAVDDVASRRRIGGCAHHLIGEGHRSLRLQEGPQEVHSWLSQ